MCFQLLVTQQSAALRPMRCYYTEIIRCFWLQIHRQFRKPLLVVAPKNLLRHPEAKSGLWEFDDKADDKGILGVRFKRLIMDASAGDRQAL